MVGFILTSLRKFLVKRGNKMQRDGYELKSKSALDFFLDWTNEGKLDKKKSQTGKLGFSFIQTKFPKIVKEKKWEDMTDLDASFYEELGYLSEKKVISDLIDWSKIPEHFHCGINDIGIHVVVLIPDMVIRDESGKSAFVISSSEEFELEESDKKKIKAILNLPGDE